MYVGNSLYKKAFIFMCADLARLLMLQTGVLRKRPSMAFHSSVWESSNKF